MTRGISDTGVEIPGYLCQGLIGRGGMGSVYRAVQLAHNRPVALKVLSVRYRDDPDFVARFHREAELLATLEHPHIVPMLEAGEVDGVPYIVMRLIDGPNLREVLRLDVPEPTTAVELLSGTAAALDFAHSRGVLHGDVKPHNMLLDHGGHVWLADFGLTQLAEPVETPDAGKAVAGTLDYLAPEIAVGQPASVASDVYALAVSAFQMLTGQLPYGSQPAALLPQARAHAARPAASAINDALMPRVDSVLSDGMAADPAARPQSAGAFVAALRDALDLPARSALSLSLATPVVDQSSVDAMSVLTDAETRSAVELTVSRGPLGGARARRRHVAAACLCLAVIVAAIAVLVLGHSGARGRSGPAPIALRAGNSPVQTAFNYAGAARIHGATLSAGSKVEISCRVSTRAQSGVDWWYRIASKPWDQQFYAPAADFVNRAGAYDPRVPVCSSFAEIPGNRLGTYTWTDYQDSGGREGAKLPGFIPARILCRIKGLVVPDGNVWWYRIGGSPWAGRFYASADAFYNNGETHGSLRGTAFVDLKVPLCGNATIVGGNKT